MPSPAARYIWAMLDDRQAEGGALLFEAVIVPHRSLSRRGLTMLLALIGLLCGLIALRFWLIGGWPVIGFSVVEVGLAMLMLGLNARRARASELVLLSEDSLRLVRIDARGRRAQKRMSAAWLNVVLEEAPGRVPRLVLVARNTREEIAAALGEAEKRDLGTALQTALHDARNPRFDNPQLRER